MIAIFNVLTLFTLLCIYYYCNGQYKPYLIGIIVFLWIIKAIINLREERKQSKNNSNNSIKVDTTSNTSNKTNITESELQIEEHSIKPQKTLAEIYGEYGEADVIFELNKLPKDDYNVINNILINHPTKLNETVQIDHVVISSFAIFVIETKNYSGWIFGNQADHMWTQSFSNGEKYRFYNPITQNANHIEALKSVLKQYNYLPFYSIVVFTDKGELKNITATSDVIYSSDLCSVINKYKLKHNKIINDIFSIVEVVNIVDEDIRNKHNENIKNKYKVSEMVKS